MIKFCNWKRSTNRRRLLNITNIATMFVWSLQENFRTWQTQLIHSGLGNLPSIVYSNKLMFQKFVKLSSVTPAELCNDTLRSMLKFLPTCAETLEGKYYCLTCHPYGSLSSRVYPIRKQVQTSITICIHLVRGGGHCSIKCLPPLVGVKIGLLGMHPITHLQGGTVQYKIDPCMQQPF